MAEVTVTVPHWRNVEVGRVVLISGETPDAGRPAVIVEIIDHNRILVEGPSSNPDNVVERKAVNLSDCFLSKLSIDKLPRGARHAAVKKLWEKAEIDAKWTETNWYKRQQRIEKRKQLTDFDRFKLMRLRKQKRFEERKALAKIKASA